MEEMQRKVQSVARNVVQATALQDIATNPKSSGQNRPPSPQWWPVVEGEEEGVLWVRTAGSPAFPSRLSPYEVQRGSEAECRDRSLGL